MDILIAKDDSGLRRTHEDLWQSTNSPRSNWGIVDVIRVSAMKDVLLGGSRTGKIYRTTQGRAT
jgi:hypothetical protein